MNHFGYRDGVLHCEETPLPDIADAVGTPAYVYSRATLERHFTVFRDAFAPQPVHIAFAVKANANIAVLRVLARLGAGADTVSSGEVKRALAAGVAPERIVFSGVGKTVDELAYALDVGVGQINVESPSELHALADIAAARRIRAPFAIRVNPDIDAGGHDKITTGGAQTKFGVGAEDAMRLYAWAGEQPGLEPLGLAVHIGSQIRDLAPLRSAFVQLRAMAEHLRAQGLPVPRLDLGGGLAAPYFDEPEPPSPAAYAAMVREVFAGLDVELAFEPGRVIAANAGVLLTRVIRLQPRARRDIIVLDAAMNDLVRPAMYDAYHDFAPVLEPSADAERAPVDLVGPVCETGDTFARSRTLPPLAPGDLAVFFTAGAYGAVMGSTYNARSLAPEVLVDGSRFAVVRRRFDVDDQLSLEDTPAWLEAEG